MPDWLDAGKHKADDVKKTSADKTEKPTGEGSNALLVAQQGAIMGELDERGAKVDVADIKKKFAAGKPRADHVLSIADTTSRPRMIEVVAKLDKEDIHELGESQVGLALVDAVVHANQNVAFTKMAIGAIFEVVFDESDWGKRDIHHMYFMFREVPKSHVKGIVNQLREGASKTDGSSWFKGNGETAQGGARGDIEMAQPLPSNLSMGAAENLLRHRTLRIAALFGATLPVGGLGALAVPISGDLRNNQKFLKARSPYSQAMRPKNAYQMTALHEIGHGVDNRLGIMDKFKAHPLFGGWEEYKDDSALAEGVVRAANYAPFAPSAKLRQKETSLARDEARVNRLEAEHVAMPEGTKEEEAAKQKKKQQAQDAKADAKISFRKGVIDRDREIEMESFGENEEHGGLTRPLARLLVGHLNDGGTVKQFATTHDLNVKQIEAHPITKAVLAGRGNGKWMRDEGTMTKVALGDRSFAQAYGPTSWVSFQIPAKREGVSHYQWRAPGEWFAEVYAHFYMGTLTGHPVYKWFKSEVHDKDPQNRPPDQQDVASPEQVAARERGEGDAGAGAGEGEGAVGGVQAQEPQAPPPPTQLPAPDQASGSAS